MKESRTSRTRRRLAATALLVGIVAATVPAGSAPRVDHIVTGGGPVDMGVAAFTLHAVVPANPATNAPFGVFTLTFTGGSVPLTHTVVVLLTCAVVVVAPGGNTHSFYASGTGSDGDVYYLYSQPGGFTNMLSLTVQGFDFCGVNRGDLYDLIGSPIVIAP